MHGRSINKSYCEQKDVTVIWETTEKPLVIYKKERVVAQMMRDDLKNSWMMTSEMGQFTQTGPLKVKWMCQTPDIYLSDQGVNVKARNVTFSQTLAQKIRSQIGKSEGPMTTSTGLLAYVAHQLQDMMVDLYRKKLFEHLSTKSTKNNIPTSFGVSTKYGTFSKPNVIEDSKFQGILKWSTDNNLPT